MATKVINVVYKVDRKELDEAKKSIKGAEDQTKKFDDQLKQAGKSAKEAGDGASKSFSNFNSVITAISWTAIIASLTAIGKKIFDIGVQQEQLNIAFTTFLGSAEKAKKLMAELTKFAIITPFTNDQVNKAAKTLLAFGSTAEEIIPTLKMIGDVSAGTGKDLAEMAVIFGQIKSTGRLMGQDLLQLINAGFNPLQVISEKTGKSVAQLKNEMEKGQISFKMVEDAFRSATSEGGLFFNLMEKQSVSVGGKISTIAGNLDEVMKSIFASNTGIIKSFVDVLQEASEGLMAFFETEEQKRDKRKQEIIEEFEVSKMTYEQELEYLFTTLSAEEARLRGATSSWDTRKEINKVDREATLAKIEDLKLQIQTIKDLAKTEKDAAKVKKEIKDTGPQKPKPFDAPEAGLIDNFTPKIDWSSWDKETNRMLEAQITFNDMLNEEKEKSDKEYTELLANETQKQKDIKQDAFNFSLGLLSMLLNAQRYSNAEESRLVDEKYQKELDAAGNNEQAKKTIEAKRKQEQDALRKRQETEDRQRRINTILAESLVNAVKALGLPPIPGANFLAAAQAVAYGAVTAAIAGKYKDGGWINGPGTTTSDSVPILASKGEFMVNAAAASSSRNLLEAINERKISDTVLHQIAASGGSSVNMMDDKGIIQAIKENKVDYVAQGYTLMKVQRSGENFKRYIRAKIQGY